MTQRPAKAETLLRGREQLDRMLKRVAGIGYERQIAAAFVINDGCIKVDKIDLTQFKNNQEEYAIADVRNKSEVNEGKIFDSAITIPLGEIRNRIDEIPTHKPIVVHCAGGYRSAEASSFIRAELGGTINVFDLEEAVKVFQMEQHIG